MKNNQRSTKDKFELEVSEISHESACIEFELPYFVDRHIVEKFEVSGRGFELTD
jgi:hypothetical protein